MVCFDADLNLLDWGSNNILAVALGSSVYLWNATTGTIDQLMELEGSDYVCSVNWTAEGNTLAVGTFNGPVQVGLQVLSSQKIEIDDSVYT